MSDLITIVLPVYGRSALLREALESVYAQNDPEWRLLIADDGSDSQTAHLIEEQQSDPRVTVVRRSSNLGLFGNLNASIQEVVTPWQLILCSDDRLEPMAIRDLKSSIASVPQARLILSSFNSIDIHGCIRSDVNGAFYDRFSPSTREFLPGNLLHPLLKYGSINGNITGMLIEQSLFNDAGYWRADWRQSADWEWLVRACTHTSVLVRRQPIAQVRVHQGQLSASNRRSQLESRETLLTLSALLEHPQLQRYPSRRQWAAHHAQFLLWNTIKYSLICGLGFTLKQLYLIHRHVGIGLTLVALLRTLPERFRIKGTSKPLLPPR